MQRVRDIIFQASRHKNEPGTGAGTSPSVNGPLQDHQLVITTQAIISTARTSLLLLEPGERCLIIRRTSTGAVCVCVCAWQITVYTLQVYRRSLHL